MGGTHIGRQMQLDSGIRQRSEKLSGMAARIDHRQNTIPRRNFISNLLPRLFRRIFCRQPDMHTAQALCQSGFICHDFMHIRQAFQQSAPEHIGFLAQFRRRGGAQHKSHAIITRQHPHHIGNRFLEFTRDLLRFV